MTWQPSTTTMSAEAARHANFSNVPQDLNFRDPTPSIISNFNELMFRSGIATANWSNLTSLIDPGLSPKQTIKAQQTKTNNVFKSDLRWWAGAAAFDVLTILIVLPMFSNWWVLDRHRTLSPLELALVFNTPLLENVHSTAGARGVVHQLGDLRVRFGAVEEEKISLTKSNDDMLGTGLSSENTNHISRWRLGIGRTENVVSPLNGMEFTA